ncbi:uncharacterized protein N7459_003147 [Penicillium hispanicum]|uniref:uncharacterized protein n=1 Tax=Penicillium hispanicum TaxID=1080232 RepID=UPI002540BDCA|nr:uncharacterized protein N7459_003147 [Penicillium hispanicum]KAJ5587382.1 hypothetical protein N7459_003147 [Penicillium hispanicum]
MQFTTAIISLLALAGSSLAVPTRRTQALELHDFSVQKIANTTDGTIKFTITDPNTGLGDSCDLLWTPENSPGLFPMTPCIGRKYEFSFRYGIGNIENFMLAVKPTNGTQTGYTMVDADAKNSHYVCKKNPTPALAEQCKWEGVLSIDL